jgi:hypothetical protein
MLRRDQNATVENSLLIVVSQFSLDTAGHHRADQR